MFNLKSNQMAKSTKSNKSSKATKVATKTVKSLYPVSSLTKNSKSNLWVAFPAGNTSRGLVFSSLLTRDAVRNATAKAFGTQMSNIRSRRVKSFRKVTK